LNRSNEEKIINSNLELVVQADNHNCCNRDRISVPTVVAVGKEGLESQDFDAGKVTVVAEL
jgi:hypothetical protein